MRVEIKSNKYQFHIARRLGNSDLELCQGSNIAVVLLPSMSLPKAPLKKIGKIRVSGQPWFRGSPLSKQGPAMHKEKKNTIQQCSCFQMPVSCQGNWNGGYLGGSEPWYAHHCGKGMKCKYEGGHKHAQGVVASILVAHDRADQHLFDIQLYGLGADIVQPHRRVTRHKAARRFPGVPKCSRTLHRTLDSCAPDVLGSGLSE